MGRIFITGDTHRDLDREKLESENFIVEEDLTKDDYVIILGDVGIIWEGWESGSKIHPDQLRWGDQKHVDWFNNKPYTTLFIDGNHENHDALSKFPEETWNGGKIHKLADSVFHLMRGQVFTICGKTFFTMGGASSIDRLGRMPGISWWRNELPSKEEYDTAIKNLKEHNMSVDYILTHDCDASLAQMLTVMSYIDPNELNEFFRKLEFEYKLQFKYWYFGHHHVDRILDDKHRCVYNDIIELDI